MVSNITGKRWANKPFVDHYPLVFSEWDYTRNAVDPLTLGSADRRKFWWVGSSCRHSWCTALVYRTAGNRGCPYCTGNRVLTGFNDLASQYPQIAAEWSSTNLKVPSEVNHNSHHSADWICPIGHLYSAPIKSRCHAPGAYGCPYCSNRSVLVGFNDVETLFPHLVSEWGPNNTALPHELAGASQKKIEWQCKLGHTWRTTVGHRATRGQGCPYCAERCIWTGFNDFQTLFPALAQEWDFTRNSLRPDNIGRGCKALIYWICPVGHSWRGSISNRTNPNNNSNCSYCSGRAILLGFNDLATTHPNLVAEWAPDNDRTPKEVSFGSGYRAKWICPEGHHYQTAVSNRAKKNGLGTKCPECREAHTSRVEGLLFDALLDLHPDAVRGYRTTVVWKEKSKRYLAVDIYIPSLNLAVEYDGEYYHSSKEEKDRTKTELLIATGYNVLRLRENNLSHIDIESSAYETFSIQWTNDPVVMRQEIGMLIRKSTLMGGKVLDVNS